MKKTKIVSIILGLVNLPIWFYLQYWILSQLNSDRLIWFLFWTYVPLIIILQIISSVVEKD